jgi:hypothetical protein
MALLCVVFLNRKILKMIKNHHMQKSKTALKEKLPTHSSAPGFVSSNFYRMCGLNYLQFVILEVSLF